MVDIYCGLIYSYEIVVTEPHASKNNEQVEGPFGTIKMKHTKFDDK